MTELTDWQTKACQHICGMYDDPVGSAEFAAEIFKDVPTEDPERAQWELDDLTKRGYLICEPVRIIGSDQTGDDVYSPTDAARELCPDRYPPPIGTARRFEDEHAEYTSWKAGGEPGPCPYCGAEQGEMHRRKYCFGMNMQVVGAGTS